MKKLDKCRLLEWRCKYLLWRKKLGKERREGRICQDIYVRERDMYRLKKRWGLRIEGIIGIKVAEIDHYSINNCPITFANRYKYTPPPI